MMLFAYPSCNSGHHRVENEIPSGNERKRQCNESQGRWFIVEFWNCKLFCFSSYVVYWCFDLSTYCVFSQHRAVASTPSFTVICLVARFITLVSICLQKNPLYIPAIYAFSVVNSGSSSLAYSAFVTFAVSVSEVETIFPFLGTLVMAEKLSA